jgi:hypothetical protein
MSFFKKVESRSRKAQEAYSDIMLKAASSMYTACFLLFFTAPATVLINAYMKNPDLGIQATLNSTLDVLLVAVILFATPAALVGKILEYYALNTIDKWALADKKEEDRSRIHRNKN